MAEKLMVVIPCYNEEEVLPETSRRLVLKMGSLMEKGLISEDSRVLLVNDGSKDRTWELISELHKEKPLFEGVKLSRNRGHQNALLAGLMTARNRCDVCISMDADLQDDMDAMDKFLEKHREGCEIVYGVRSKREKDTFFKRETALMFYRLMSGHGRGYRVQPCGLPANEQPGAERAGRIQGGQPVPAGAGPDGGLPERHGALRAQRAASPGKANIPSKKCWPSPSTALPASPSSRSG